MDKKDERLIERLAETKSAIESELGKIIVGQKKVIEEILLALFANGHVLLIGVPGLAKTMIVNCLAQILDLSFKRIQFTPDLMPSDITGTEILEEKTGGKRDFRFVPGPIFANIILADEINRTPPKTQAALLEAMQERRVTVAGRSMDLPLPFFVLATQNPIEQEGTYPLPEAQLDRFMFNILIDYPSKAEEKRIVSLTTSAYEPKLNKVLKRDEILRFQALIRRVPVADEVLEFSVELVNRTRPDHESAPDFIKDYLWWGAGPRASQYLILGAKTYAALSGRYTPLRSDVLRVAKLVLRHRLILNFKAQAEGLKPDTIIDRLIASLDEGLNPSILR
ncbi:AAA family ATPase [candidate division WOR-3 bacterium]|uniref:AAA family ATPase n=1 Tax=candidate division WOR-3 bacterium TaxID=2052148 RepID=A0A660SE45_UNCW3|nr:MAG: AAA family ATPase [candidate division WOR-3 bacterium]